MRLYNYLNESIEKHLEYYNPTEKVELKNAWEKIQKDCGPVLKELKNANDFLYRGMTRQGYFLKKKVRTNRQPLTTSKKLHQMFDMYFKGKFGWNARSNGLFVTGSSNDAASYGPKTYMIFPIGNFKYIWSPEVGDLFIFASQNKLTGYEAEKLPASIRYERTSEALDDGNYTDKRLAEAINSENEIMIKTDTYYAMDIFFQPVMEELIFKGKTLNI